MGLKHSMHRNIYGGGLFYPASWLAKKVQRDLVGMVGIPYYCSTHSVLSSSSKTHDVVVYCYSINISQGKNAKMDRLVQYLLRSLEASADS